MGCTMAPRKCGSQEVKECTASPLSPPRMGSGYTATGLQGQARLSESGDQTTSPCCSALGIIETLLHIISSRCKYSYLRIGQLACRQALICALQGRCSLEDAVRVVALCLASGGAVKGPVGEILGVHAGDGLGDDFCLGAHLIEDSSLRAGHSRTSLEYTGSPASRPEVAASTLMYCVHPQRGSCGKERASACRMGNRISFMGPGHVRPSPCYAGKDAGAGGVLGVSPC